MKDASGLALTLSNPAALEPYDRAVRAALTFRGDAVAIFDEALALAPDFVAAHVAKAMVLMTFFERRFAQAAAASLDAATPHLAATNPRERALVAATRKLVVGDWHGGVAALDQVLVENPRDVLALQVAHGMDFFRGDSLNLRNRISRVLPHWSSGLPMHSFVLGMHAFGLEECNQYSEAESAGRKALELAPENIWAVHAVVHVMEMQGRMEEGIAFLRERQLDWATADNGFAFHNWWHLALFNMDQGDFDGALKVYDEVLAAAHGVALSRLDATSLLWRLRLEGVDVGARFEAVADAWQADLGAEGGFYAFNDFHAAMAFAATGRTESVRQLRSVLEDAAGDKHANGEMTRVVGLDTSEAAIDFCAGNFARAAARLAAVRDGAWRFGGSHAQRDVLSLTLIESARRSGNASLAAHYVQERMVHKPASQWGARLMRRIGAAEAAGTRVAEKVH